MATFGGDLLRILAHGGMSMGTQALGTYLGNALAGDRQKEALGIQDLATQIRNTPDQETQQSLLKKMWEMIGTEAPMVNKLAGYSPPGLEPSAATPNPEDVLLKTQTGPTALQGVEGATPINKTMIAGPVPTLEALRVKTAGDMPAEDIQNALFPKDRDQQLRELQIRGQMGDRAAQRELQALNLQGLQEYRQGMLTLHQSNQQILNSFRQQNLDLAKERLAQVTDDKERARQEGQISKITALHGRIAGTFDPEEKKQLQTEANAIIKGSNNPIIKNYPLYTEDTVVPGTGVTLPIVGNVFGTKVKVPIGTAPSTAPKPAGETTTLTFPRRVKAGGQETVVNSQEEYDDLKRKYSK